MQVRPVIRAGSGATPAQQIPSGEAGHRIRHLGGTRECGCTRRSHEHQYGRPTAVTAEQLRASACLGPAAVSLPYSPFLQNVFRPVLAVARLPVDLWSLSYLGCNFSNRFISASSACMIFSELRWPCATRYTKDGSTRSCFAIRVCMPSNSRCQRRRTSIVGGLPKGEIIQEPCHVS
jgi:hypothetical protein